jgi:hypothetical protein
MMKLTKPSPKGPTFILMALWLLLTPHPADAKALRVGIYQNSPKVFVDADGRPKGIFVDIVREYWTRGFSLGKSRLR